VEKTGVGEVGKGGQVDCSGQEDRKCVGEDSRDEVKDSGERLNFLAGIQRGGDRDSGEN